MEVRFLFVCVASTMWLLEPAHGKFADFLGHLPKKMGVSDVSIAEAFETTWTRLTTTLRASIRPKRIKRMGIFRPVTPIVFLKDYTTTSDYLKHVIPILSTSKSRYSYLWQSTLKETESVGNMREATNKRSSEVSSVLPLLLHTTQGPMGSRKKAALGQDISFDVAKLKSFKIRVSYKWQLDFL